MLPMDNLVKDRSREKMLTTTPIPSDKSSDGRNSSSSSSSGSDHSPDHVVDRLSVVGIGNISGKDTMNRKHTNSQSGSSVRDPVKNTNSLKNYPCYRNMNLIHFNTINFSPVMDSLHMSNGESIAEPLKKNLSNSLDINSSVPTSDCVVEIDETVTSPQENIPVSPSTPIAVEHCDTTSEHVRENCLRGTKATGSSYIQLQSANNNSNTQNDRNFHVLGSSRLKQQGQELHKTVSMHHQETRKDVNNNNMLKKNKNNNAEGLQLHDTRIKEKQRKQRISKHQRQKPSKQITDKNARRVELTNASPTTMSTASPQSSNIRPKVNADPTKKKVIPVRQTEVPRSQSNGSVQQRHMDASTYLPKESFPKTFTSLQNANTPSSHHDLAENQESKSNYSPTLVTANTNSPRSTPFPSGRRVQQWQTVTAVQGPKLPPVLSEQDRIPKRGRPSKKMMQENLRVKMSDAVTDKVTFAAPTVTQAKLSQPTPLASRVVSMYTINDKGLMEEIAPKLKENRRSKERVQAFQNLLAEIRSSSEKRMSAVPKFGEKSKQPSSEKQIKKRAKPRTKVFGRPSSQPLSESGITQTMCTFSELAQQFKISDSIVSRATENLLRSAAVKRNKDQLQVVSAHISSQSIKSLHSHKEKGVPPNRHCESVNTIASQPTSISNSTRFQDSVSKSSSNENGKKLSESDSCQGVSKTGSSDMSSLDIPNVPTTAHQRNLTASSDVTASSTALPDPEVAEASDTSRTAKSKRKKKKHKKHKKHKYAESKNAPSSKKKKKDKKKKEKKKLKAKLAVPSSTALVTNTKSPIKNKSTEKTTPHSDKASAVIETNMPSLSKSTITQDSNTRFSLNFRQAVTDMNVETNDDMISWPNEDQTYDGEDSSTDGEISASNKSFVDSSVKSSAAPSDNTPSFAQYSNSTLGFGMFHNQKSAPFQEQRSDEVNKVIAIEGNKSQGNVYGTSGGVRSRKHHKHKRRKPYRKSKNICDPAFLVLLDQVLFNLKTLKLTTTMLKPASGKQTAGNIFFAAMSTESVHDLVWKSPSKTMFKTTASKTATQLGIVRGTAFRNDTPLPTNLVRKSYPKLTDLMLSVSKSNPMTSANSKAFPCSVGTLSYFCRSPFFQKYGYVSKMNENISTSVESIYTAPTSTSTKTDNAAICVPTQSLTSLSTTPEKTHRSLEAPILKQKVGKSGKQERRKRGWPLGKPRGPRTKKIHIEDSTQAATEAPGINSAFDRTANAKTDISTRNNSSIDLAINKVSNSPSGKTQNAKTPTVQSANSTHQQQLQNRRREDEISIAGTSEEVFEPAENDQRQSLIGKKESPTEKADRCDEKNAELKKNFEGVVNESLLKQIKQAIEASLSAIPSINKDAITKSVDDAVLSYLERINNTGLLENRSTGGDVTTSCNQVVPAAKSQFVKKKSTKRNNFKSRVAVSQPAENITTDNKALAKNSLLGSRSSAEKHPKKVWAYKHQDTEIQIPTKPNLSSTLPISLVSMEPELTKRRTGRPKKTIHSLESPSNTTLDDVPLIEAALPGKLPTASATVLPPRKQRNITPIIAFKQPVKRPVGRPKKATIAPNHIGGENNSDLDRVKSRTKSNRSSVISKEQARLSVAALQTVKSMQVKSKITHYNSVKEPGFYEGTLVEDHIAEAIEITVNNSEWDNYKEFEAACLKIETDGCFMEEGDLIDGRRKAAITKKSLESVVEKLKSKQAQNIMHNAATALLQLHEVHSQVNASDASDTSVKSYQERRAELEDMKRVARRHDIYERIIATKKNLNHINKILKVFLLFRWRLLPSVGLL